MLANGSSGDEVTALQNTLSKLGYDVGEADGIFGAKTEAAVKAFQESQGLSADGVYGPDSAKAAGAALTARLQETTKSAADKAEAAKGNIMDMAKFVAPKAEVRIIGIRPGEKLHELMIPNDEAMNTIEFSDHYIIGPNARWWKDRRDFYMTAELGGKRVPNDYEYSSGRNTQWITAEYVHKEIKNLQDMERSAGKNSKDDLSAPSPTNKNQQDTSAMTGASRM